MMQLFEANGAVVDFVWQERINRQLSSAQKKINEY